jgi:type IV secretory pathway VirB4 component
LLFTAVDVIGIDPAGESAPRAEMLGGAVIRTAPGSGIYIHPLDMDKEYAKHENSKSEDPISLKSSFILSLFEVIIGGHYGLSPAQRTIIDRTTRLLYQNYVVDFDVEKIPTLLQFQQLLKSQPEREAKELALALEIYTSGSLDIFAHKTNVDIDSRFTIYNIKDVGNNMKTMAMLVVLDNIWNRMIENRRKGKRTWFYIDEIYLLINNEVSAQFLQELYKRARKWNGVPTGITQNIEDILKSETARTMLSNSSFIMMLNQAPLDKIQLAELLNISDTQLSFITNAEKGEGLIYTGKTIVPFVDKFPTNTKLYKAMTTKPGE